MSILLEEARFVAGVVIGAAGMGVAWALGPSLLESGWTSAASCLVLAGASAVVASERWVLAKVDPIMRDPSATTARDRSGGAWRQAEDSAGWLRSAGADTVPADELPDLVRTRLAGSLHPVEEHVRDPEAMGLSPQAAALCAALAARSLGGARWKEGRRLMHMLSGLAGEPAFPDEPPAPEGVMGMAKGLLQSEDIGEALGRCMRRHGTRETFAMSLLAEARKAGPVGTGEFRWLRRSDRALWYALDNLGRQTFHVEGLAAMDHFRHEIAADRRLMVPHVAMAAVSLAREAGRAGGNHGGTPRGEDVSRTLSPA